jgi:hypothetical protein
MALARASLSRKIFLDPPKVSGLTVRLWTNQEGTEAYLAIEDYAAVFDAQKEFQVLLLGIQQKLLHGLDTAFLEEKLPTLLARRITFYEQLIAQGESAKPGEDARIEFLVMPASGQFAIRPDGTCDFKNRDILKSVQADEVILRKLPAVPGKSGMSVFGKLLPPPAVKDVQIVLGKNIRQEEQDGVVTVISSSSGKVVYNRGNVTLNVSVSPLLEIRGDIDYSTGNVFFKGSLEISGSVLSGFSVVATGNIIVHGMIEANAKVTAGGDLQVFKGIIGTNEAPESGEVKAFGNIQAQYAENAYLVAEGDILLRSAMNCQIRTNGRLIVDKALFGGESVAFKSITAGEIGNIVGISTTLRAGISHSTFNRLNLMIKIVDDLKNQLEKVEKDLLFVKTMGDSLEPLKKGELSALLAQKARNLQEQIMKLEMKKADATIELLEENQSTISGGLFRQGGMLFIRSSRLKINFEQRMTTFYQKLPEETIESRPYLPDTKGKTKSTGRSSR